MCPTLAGPFVSALANRYGFRLVAILGSVISCSAFVLSYFSTSIEFLYISYGVLGKFLPYIQGGASKRVFKYSRGSWKLWTLLRTDLHDPLLSPAHLRTLRCIFVLGNTYVHHSKAVHKDLVTLFSRIHPVHARFFLLLSRKSFLSIAGVAFRVRETRNDIYYSIFQRCSFDRTFSFQKRKQKKIEGRVSMFKLLLQLEISSRRNDEFLLKH